MLGRAVVSHRRESMKNPKSDQARGRRLGVVVCQLKPTQLTEQVGGEAGDDREQFAQAGGMSCESRWCLPLGSSIKDAVVGADRRGV